MVFQLDVGHYKFSQAMWAIKYGAVLTSFETGVCNKSNLATHLLLIYFNNQGNMTLKGCMCKSQCEAVSLNQPSFIE